MKASPAPSKKKPLYKSLFLQILIAVVARVLMGHFWPDLGPQLRPLGEASLGAAVVFIGLLFVVAWGFARVPLGQFLKYTREEFLLALGTTSTEAVMPRIMTKLTNAGCSRATTGLVVPAGYSFNLDGAAIYLSISLLFLAQAFGRHLDLGQQLAALGVLLLTPKGMAGVALLLGADRLMDSMRVVVNLLGNCVATFVVSKWEGQFDRGVMLRTFRGEITNHDSAVMLGVEEDFQDQELERISKGGQASPKFRGGPTPGEMPEFEMSRPSAAINHE